MFAMQTLHITIAKFETKADDMNEKVKFKKNFY